MDANKVINNKYRNANFNKCKFKSVIGNLAFVILSIHIIETNLEQINLNKAFEFYQDQS